VSAVSNNHRTPLSVLSRRPSATTTLLLIVCLAQFMVILDVSIVNVALPSMRRGLHFSTTGLQWVVNLYTLTFAGFLMLGGRCADLVGRRRVFLAGTALFTLSSLACALASSRGLLLGARTLQGLGGAVLSPATLAIVTSSFAAGPERNRAVGVWGAMGALGGSSGALLGGVFTQAFGWPAIFAINVPLGLLVLALVPRLVPADGHRHTGDFDLAGAVLITSSLIGATFAIVRTGTLGWGSPGVLGPLAGGVVLLAAFLLVEGRLAKAPLIPLPVLRRGRLRAANLVVALLYAGFFPVWFFLTLYLQEVLHFDAIQAGLSFLPMTGSIFFASTIAPRAVGRYGPRKVIAAGMSTATVGMLLLIEAAPGGSYAADVLPGALLTSIGMGFALVPSTIVAMQALPSSQSGIGSGLLNTARLMGGALGLAILSTIAAAQTRSDTAAGAAHALTHGFDLAFGVGAAFTLAGAALAAARLRDVDAAPRQVELSAGTLAEVEEGESLAA
jgi:EmrB/QacA subfamily drug resistance transporter